MARRHSDLPTSAAIHLSKAAIFSGLARIDADAAARTRVLEMERRFRQRVAAYFSAKARKGTPMTNPFVLMMHAHRMNYRSVPDVERDIIAGSGFASIETEAGKMVERVTFETFKWKIVESAMHSDNTVFDAWIVEDGTLKCATLKSGPRCLNDAMAKDIGSDIAAKALGWATNNEAHAVDFSYGVIYGTPARSNKKDWHVLRTVAEALPPTATVLTSHKRNWSLRYTDQGVEVSAAVRLGLDWWTYLGGPDAWIEVSTAFIRACIEPTTEELPFAEPVAEEINVAILQRSQLDWLLLTARHFCDKLIE